MQLQVHVGASSFDVPWTELKTWRSVLNCAESISLHDNGRQLGQVDLNDPRVTRWIAFESEVNGSPFACVGYQETLGARQANGLVVSGSNRKVLVWCSPDGGFYVGEKPG